jgi:phosphomannomutase/phosphoglucomutase
MTIKLLLTGLCIVSQLSAQSIQTIIFAAGKSKRFDGTQNEKGEKTSKLLTKINGKPIISYPIQAALTLDLPMTLVVGHQGDEVKTTIQTNFPDADITFTLQKEQLGTGDALKCTRSHWNADAIMVLNGDHPLTSPFMLSKLIHSHNQAGADISILVSKPTCDCNWGRIVTQDSKTRIIEAVDFTLNPDDYPLVNAGYYIFNRTFLEDHIDELWLHENKKEYYVTDLIEIANRYDLKINCVEVPFDDVFGINTQDEFNYAQELIEQKENRILSRSIFKEYDIRGIVEKDLHIDEIYNLGRSFAYLLKTKSPAIKTVAVGMDGRLHSTAIKEQLVAGLLDSGIDVIFVGLCPSPALYFATHTLPVDAAIMITASHNPKEYNGFKICLGRQALWGEDIQELYRCYVNKLHIKTRDRGSYAQQDIVPLYVDWLVEKFSHLKHMQLSALIDCGNGAAGAVIPLLIERMEWKNVKALYAEVDGNYPHHEADPVKIENMCDLKEHVLADGYDIGIGLDGDADRMAPLTRNGTLVSGDLLLGIYAQEILKEHKDLHVVFDVKSSSLLMERLNSIGAHAHMSATGHVHVKEMMRKTDALLAGEVSCHFCFKDRYFGYDDGIYAMLRLFERLEQNEQKLDDLLQIYPEVYSTPEIRIACPEEKMKDAISTIVNFFSRKQNAEMITIDGVRVILPYGWGIVRASHTEPVLSMRFESTTADGLERITNDFSIAMRNYVNRQQVRRKR